MDLSDVLGPPLTPLVAITVNNTYMSSTNAFLGPAGRAGLNGKALSARAHMQVHVQVGKPPIP